jgi:hypothetical protein
MDPFCCPLRMHPLFGVTSAAWLQLRDLLCDDGMLGHDHRLEIRTVGTQSGTTVQIPQLTRVEIKNVQEALAVYDRGCANRSVAATNVHEHSSRSHCVVTIEIIGT